MRPDSDTSPYPRAVAVATLQALFLFLWKLCVLHAMSLEPQVGQLQKGKATGIPALMPPVQIKDDGVTVLQAVKLGIGTVYLPFCNACACACYTCRCRCSRPC